MTAVEYILNLVTGEDASGKDVKVIDVIDINEIQQAKEMEQKQMADMYKKAIGEFITQAIREKVERDFKSE